MGAGVTPRPWPHSAGVAGRAARGATVGLPIFLLRRQNGGVAGRVFAHVRATLGPLVPKAGGDVDLVVAVSLSMIVHIIRRHFARLSFGEDERRSQPTTGLRKVGDTP